MDKHKRLAEDFLRRLAPQTAAVIVGRDDGLQTYHPIDERYFLAERFARLVQADTEWFEKVISHQPTVGTFYEILLRNALKELAPIGCEIGTGFVLDPLRPVHSKQLDIIVYDRSRSSPIFKNGDLVVVRPSSTLSVTEVKKTLVFRDIERTIDATFFANLGSRNPKSEVFDGVQNVNIFGFASKLNPEKVAKNIRDYLEKKIRYTRVIAGPERRTGSITIEKIVLPNVFIRDNRFYILSHLTPTKDPMNFKISVTVYESHEANGCMGAYLLNALPMLIREQRAFIGSELLVIKEEFQTEGYLALRTITSMDDIDYIFPNDSATIRQFRINGKQPFAVMIPKGLHWKKMKSFTELVQLLGKHAFITDIPDGHGDEKARRAD